MKYVTLLMEKQHMETVTLFLQAFLGNENSVERTVDNIPILENMIKQSFQKVKKMMKGNEVQEKKDILKFFKWSIKNGKTLETLRVNLLQEN